MQKKDVRLQLVISKAEVDALEAWCARKGVWSRSAAIRQLIAKGIATP
jgi:hypothetical protein